MTDCYQTNLPLPLKNRGKVRDVYDLGDSFLIVATDRLSAFDVIMNKPIPHKGYVLTAISEFWFSRLADIIPNHFISSDIESMVPALRGRKELYGRSMIVKKAEPLPVECIVRGYLSGSAWESYKKNRTVCGLKFPAGLLESSKLPEPVFTPSTKAELGRHDENISIKEAEKILGTDTAGRIAGASIALFNKASRIAAQAGIILADTKFEFGFCNNELILIDEVLTPDSSRFWPATEYAPGRSQKSFDKQFVRDYLSALHWQKTPPPPTLPADIISKTSEKYLEILQLLAGKQAPRAC